MIRFLVNRPIAVTVSFFAAILLGLFAYSFLPTALLPQTDIPQITVHIHATNFSTEQIEHQLTTSLRHHLQQISGLEEIQSQSENGHARIRLNFEPGEPIGLRFIEVNEKIDMAMNHFPQGIARPLVVKNSVDDIPLFQLHISPKHEQINPSKIAEISSLTRKIIKQQLEQIPEIAMVDLTGFILPEIQVRPKFEVLESLGLDIYFLSNIFSNNKFNINNIQVKDGNLEYFLQFISETQTLESIAKIPINLNGRLFYLSDLATIHQTFAKRNGAFYSQDKPSINVSLIKKSSAKVKSLQKNVQELIKQMEIEYPDLEFKIRQDQTELLSFAISNLQQDLVVGGILALLFMLIFIRRLGPALLIGLSIPVSLIISLLGLFMFEISLNIISLGGLILGLSMIIDNSIVVIDNIHRHQDSGLNIHESAIIGTQEVTRPLITSVLTNCAVFIPLLFMNGLAGAIFFDQAISITIGVFSSLIVAILLVPPLYVLTYKNTSRHTLKVRVNVTSWYERGLYWCFQFQKTTFLFVGIFIWIGIIVFNRLDKTKLPQITKLDSNLIIDWNESINPEESWKRVDSITKQLKLVEHHTWIGEQQYLLEKTDHLKRNQVRIYMKADREMHIDFLKKEIYKLVKNKFPLASLEFTPAKNAFDEIFSNQMAPIQLQIQQIGNNNVPPPHSINPVLDSLKAWLPHLNIEELILDRNILLKLDTQKASQYGFELYEIYTYIKSTLNSVFLEYFSGAHELIPIVIPSPKQNDIHKLLNQTSIQLNNSKIPLYMLFKSKIVRDYPSITGGKQGIFYPIKLYTDQAEKDLLKIKRSLKKHFPDLEITYSGSYFKNNSLIHDMLIILCVSVLLLYFILAAQFESLIQPLFILVELPVALSGALIFLYISGSSINIMSLIGIVIMCGLVINDSILKVDAINHLKNQGTPILQAIFEGGQKRLKPMVMITLTSLGALLPTLFMSDIGSEIQKPLALALMGGMTLGLFASLFFIPLIYWAIYKNKKS